MAPRPRTLRAAVCVAAGLALVSLVDARGFRRYFQMQRQVAEVSERNRQLAKQNEALKREIEGLRSDPETWERATREELGFIRPDEIVINLE
jgi:cell division protein FtsB